MNWANICTSRVLTGEACFRKTFNIRESYARNGDRSRLCSCVIPHRPSRRRAGKRLREALPYIPPQARGVLVRGCVRMGLQIHTYFSPVVGGGRAKIINTNDKKNRFIEYSGETESRSWNTIGLFLVGSLVTFVLFGKCELSYKDSWRFWA